MTVDRAPALRRPRLRRALRLIEDAPAPAALAIGFAVLLLGGFIVTRPLTSLWLLAVLVGISAIISGLLGLADAESAQRAALDAGTVAPSRRASAIGGWNRAICILWIAGGIAVLVWLGRSIQLLPAVLSVLLVLGGLGSLAGATRGRVSERVLAVASSLAQVVFGILALAWPEATVVVLSLILGLQILAFGIVLLVAAFAGPRAPQVATA